ncbi:hypothetical protein [Caballeronia sp. DA-9]|uniref:hypothetical protein n=1 Tax=Caballeronia sp. DA-9 TaxID=3436237 RepID=UPI003F678211
MTTELMRYEGHRFLLYKKWDYAPNGRTKEQTEALEAGKALFKAANFEHWASQPELVKRIQTFLVDSFPSYRSNPCGDRPGDIIKTFCWEVRNEAAVIVRAKPEYIVHNGFVPKREFDYAAYKRDLDERGRAYMARSKAYSDDLKAYNKSIDDRIRREANALKPYRHIETMAEAQARTIAARAARDDISALASSVVSALSAVASSLPSIEVDTFDLGGASKAGASPTPLADAVPFEFGEMPAFGGSYEIAKTPNYGEPGTWYTNPGSGQMRLYGDTGAPVVDFDFDHDHGQGIPHAHNYGAVGADGAFSREGGRSFSILPR